MFLRKIRRAILQKKYNRMLFDGASIKDLRKVKEAISLGADVNAPVMAGAPVLFFTDDLDIIELFLDAGADFESIEKYYRIIGRNDLVDFVERWEAERKQRKTAWKTELLNDPDMPGL